MEHKTKQEYTQIDIFKLWKEAEIYLGEEIKVKLVIKESGCYHSDIKRMLEGELVDGSKVALVVSALYQISGMLKPERLEIQTVKTTTWLEVSDE